MDWGKMLVLLAVFIATSSCEETLSVVYGQNSLISSLCPNVSHSLLQEGINYGSVAYHYNLTTIGTLELTSPQALILSLLNSLVTGDETSCNILAECAHRIQQLESRHLELWLREDFSFPDQEVKLAMFSLDAMVADEGLNLPSHVLKILSSLADVYGITRQSKEYSEELMLELENAVVNNSSCDIITLATKGGNVNGSTQSGDRLVHLAVKTGSRSSIAALGYLKADIEVRNTAGTTPMEEAIKTDSLSSIKELLLAGANIEKRMFKGNTYLHIAAATGKNKALQALLEEGLEPNKKNYLGETPLLLAVIGGNVRGVEILLQRGADPNLVSKNGKSPFLVAIESNNIYMFKALINSGIIPDFDLKNGDTLVHLIVRMGNAIEMLQVLKGRRVSVNIKNKDGLAPLHIATDQSVVRMLLRMGSDVNFRTEKGETALHIASASGSLEIVRVLVQLSARVDIQDNEGNTALMVAVKNSNSKVVIFLLENGADPTLKNNAGQTMLHAAAKIGCVECVTVLLDAGASVDETDNNGNAPIFSAVINNNLTILQLLLEHGADPEAKGENGWTPLIIASANGHLEVVKLLIDKGASVNYKAGRYTALSTAVYNHQKAVEDYLRSIEGIE